MPPSYLAQDPRAPNSRLLVRSWFASSRSRFASSLSRLPLCRSLRALSSSHFRLLRSRYVSSVCWDRIIDNSLLVDWVPTPAGGLVGRRKSPASYSVVLPNPGFLARSNPLTPLSTFQDSHPICSWFEILSEVQPTISTASVADSLHYPCDSSCRMALSIIASLSSTCVYEILPSRCLERL